jgi:hypothetical protein
MLKSPFQMTVRSTGRLLISIPSYEYCCRHGDPERGRWGGGEMERTGSERKGERESTREKERGRVEEKAFVEQKYRKHSSQVEDILTDNYVSKLVRVFETLPFKSSISY